VEIDLYGHCLIKGKRDIIERKTNVMENYVPANTFARKVSDSQILIDREHQSECNFAENIFIVLVANGIF